MSDKIKHAYLIIAHHEFRILQMLLHSIDDVRNDIYIHFDKKLKDYPEFVVKYAGCYILENRVDVRWGHVSQIKAEYTLFEAASKRQKYQYYHLISGVHFPLKSQDYIHHFFSQLQNCEVMSYMPTSSGEIDLKMQRYNLFMKNYKCKCAFYSSLNQLLWRIGIRIQKILCINRNVRHSFYKASNWVSITNECVRYLLSIKEYVLIKYRYSLCGDEFFIPSELENSLIKWNILYTDKLLKCDFKEGANPCIYRLDDYEDLMKSDCLFARKFGSEDVINKILCYINSK